ncbi:glycerophosphodiester phosphodiesterase family protein [Alkalinema pantanalense CENA528]|uniref:glycerophosphodiester phosphodiesterase family protein n=1 Tax=Alkalinema pantanalense TaxID=1620705 RepID=UPI003D6EF06B
MPSPLGLALGLLSSIALPGGPSYVATPAEGTCCLVIAHAAGSISGNVLTNSREALEANYAIGTRWFEIDLLATSDGVLVAAHDWTNWRRFVGDEGDQAPALEEFRARRIVARASAHGVPGDYAPMTFDDLEAFLARHPDAVVVTDTKGPLADVEAAVAASPRREQFVLQAYSVAEVAGLAERGFGGRIILTLYKLPVAYDDALVEPFLAEVAPVRHALAGFTVPLSFAARGDNIRRLSGDDGTRVYVHGQPNEINAREVQAAMAARGASGFYLD